jgi:hypothetical protein
MNNERLFQDFIPTWSSVGMHDRFNSRELNIRKLKNLEDRTMVYSRPEVTKLASSIEAIQSGTQKVLISPLDGYPMPDKITTPGAYEADE